MTVPAADNLRQCHANSGRTAAAMDAAADLLDAIAAALPDPWADEPVTYEDAVVALTTIYDLLRGDTK